MLDIVLVSVLMYCLVNVFSVFVETVSQRLSRGAVYVKDLK